MSKKENKVVPSDIKFEFDGIPYEFAALKFKIRMSNGKPDNDGVLKEVTAEEAANDVVILAHLVEIKSGLIVAGEAEESAEQKVSDLKVDELKEILTKAEVEFDPKAKKAELVALVEALNEGGE